MQENLKVLCVDKDFDSKIEGKRSRKSSKRCSDKALTPNSVEASEPKDENIELSVVHYFLDEEIFPDLESYCASNVESINNQNGKQADGQQVEDIYSHIDINELNSSKESQNGDFK